MMTAVHADDVVDHAAETGDGEDVRVRLRGQDQDDNSLRVTPPLFPPSGEPQNRPNPPSPHNNTLDQPAPARAQSPSYSPDSIVQTSTQQPQRDPAEAVLLVPWSGPVAHAEAASEGPPARPLPPGQQPEEQPLVRPPAPPPLLDPTAPPYLPFAQPIADSPSSSTSSSSLASPLPSSTSPPLLPHLRSTSPAPPPPPPPPSALPPLSLSPEQFDHHHHHLHLAATPNMIFSDLYKSPKSPFSKLRQHHASHQQPSEENRRSSELLDYGDPDLISRDKAKQKEAVRRYLAKKVRNDWSFTWPLEYTSVEAAAAAEMQGELVRARLVRAEQIGLLEPSETFASPLSQSNVPLAAVSAAVATASPNGYGSHDHVREDSGAEAESDSDTESIYSTVSEDAVHFRSRAEWTSDVSDDDNKTGNYYQRMPTYVQSPFRFDTPDSVGTVVKASADARKAKARRDLRAEIVWNEGLACYTARRDAWTGARTVRVKPAKPLTSPTSPVSPRRGLFRFHTHSKSEPAPVVAVPTPTAAAPAAATQDTDSASSTPTGPATGTAATVAGAAATVPLSPVTSNSRHSQHSRQSHHSHQSHQSRQSNQSQHSQQSIGLETVATTPLTSDGGGGGGVDGSLLHRPASHPSCDTASHLAPTRSRASHTAAGLSHPEYAVETLIPVAPPLLPPANPMRASITPSLYLNLYDKVVLHSLQPSCPINLSDMIRACVVGWKRDGEWPPRSEMMSAPAAAAVAVALRKKKRDERREVQKEKRDVTSTAASGGLTSPGFGRRMSSFLGRPTSAAGVVSPTSVTASGTLAAPGRTSPTEGDKDDDGIGGNRGIRRSLQRVLGLGYIAHGGGHTHGGHGHSASVGSVGQGTKEL